MFWQAFTCELRRHHHMSYTHLRRTHTYTDCKLYISIEQSSLHIFISPYLLLLILVHFFAISAHDTITGNIHLPQTGILGLGFHFLRTKPSNSSPYPKRPRCLGTSYSERIVSSRGIVYFTLFICILSTETIS